ncbi:MAG: NF038143 family protein, partial [Desulfobacterales bacterium]
QLREIDLLIDHYLKLLQAEGDDYASLVLSAYPTNEDYRVFQQKLTSIEKQVAQTARRTLGAQTDADMLIRIESATDELRSAEIQQIFDSIPRR